MAHMSSERECLWGYKGGHALPPAAAWAVASAAAALAPAASVGPTHLTPSVHERGWVARTAERV